MYRILIKEDRDGAALSTLLEICYLDLNGPSNLGGVTDEEFLKEFPPWDATKGWTAPALIEWINDLMKKLNYSIDEVYNIYLKTANRNFRALKLPVTPGDAWIKLKEEITQYSNT